MILRTLLALLIASTTLLAGDQCAQQCIDSYRSCVSNCRGFDPGGGDICRQSCEYNLNSCIDSCQ